jgi:hypothetical protein
MSRDQSCLSGNRPMKRHRIVERSFALFRPVKPIGKKGDVMSKKLNEVST